MNSTDTRTSTASITSDTLLAGLADSANRTLWQQFVDRYRPPIVRFARRRGLGTEDAEDAAQRTLLTFAESYQAGRYERPKGRLRDWLFGIARNQIRKTRRLERNQEVPLDSESDPHEGPRDDDPDRELWEHEWRQEVLRFCLAQVRLLFDAQTLDAFELFAHQGWPAARVAQQLGLSENAVYLAKHRVLKRLRQMTPQIEDIF